MVTGLFAGQHNTKLHGTITGVIYETDDIIKKFGVKVTKCHFECVDMEPFPRLDCHTPWYKKGTKQMQNSQWRLM